MFTDLPPAIRVIDVVRALWVLSVPHVDDFIHSLNEERKLNGVLLEITKLQTGLDTCVSDTSNRIGLCHSQGGQTVER